MFVDETCPALRQARTSSRCARRALILLVSAMSAYRRVGQQEPGKWSVARRKTLSALPKALLLRREKRSMTNRKSATRQWQHCAATSGLRHLLYNRNGRPRAPDRPFSKHHERQLCAFHDRLCSTRQYRESNAFLNAARENFDRGIF